MSQLRMHPVLMPDLKSLVLPCVFLLLAGINVDTVKAEITAEQRAKLAELTMAMQRAGVLFTDNKFVECSALLTEVRQELQTLLEARDATLQRLAKPIYLRLVRAGELLEAKGVHQESMPDWADFLRSANGSPEGVDASLSSRPASGLEKISFAKQIAPILLDNCNGCHLGGRRDAGNFSMGTFARLQRGGDSGEVISGRNAAESLLIRKLKGQEGQRMPAGGRPPLSSDEITLISTWIEQGSVFDGPSEDANLEVVVSQAWATGVSHSELFERRQQRAMERWSRVLPGDSPQRSTSSELFVLGNVPASRIEQTLDRFERAIKLVKKLFKLPTDEPLLKGGLAVFVLKSRYDYSEFGLMTENRELPRDWLGHWHADALDVYAVLMAIDLDDKPASALSLQLTAGAYLGAFNDVPFWFAEGAARNLVATSFKRDDERVGKWQRALPAALQRVENAGVLVENRLDEEAAGVVGLGLASYLMDRKNRKRFDDLLELLRSGRSFNEALTFSFAPPEVLIKTWLGK